MIRRRRGQALPVAAAVALHVAVLLPLALSGPAPGPVAPVTVIEAIPLDLTPRPTPRPAPASLPRPAATALSGDGPREAEIRSILDPAARSVPAPPSHPLIVPRAQGEGQPGGLRFGPPLAVCPPAPGDPIGQRRCGLGREPPGETYAELGPPRGDASAQARQEAFDRQARANEAWREYTRGEGAYPGLRSLFTER